MPTPTEAPEMSDDRILVSRAYIAKLELVRDRARALLRNPASRASAQPLYDAVQASLEETPAVSPLNPVCTFCDRIGPCLFDGNTHLCLMRRQLIQQADRNTEEQ